MPIDYAAASKCLASAMTHYGGFRRICVARRRAFLKYDALHEAWLEFNCGHGASGRSIVSRASRR